MVIRRVAEPHLVQHVWDAVHCITHQRQQINDNRLIRYLQRVANLTPAQAERAIKDCLQDGLLRLGKNQTDSTTTYRLPRPDETPEDDGHDWYCFECHRPGDVNFCRTCHRVFHADCISKSRQSCNEDGAKNSAKKLKLSNSLKNKSQTKTASTKVVKLDLEVQKESNKSESDVSTVHTEKNVTTNKNNVNINKTEINSSNAEQETNKVASETNSSTETNAVPDTKAVSETKEVSETNALLETKAVSETNKVPETNAASETNVTSEKSATSEKNATSETSATSETNATLETKPDMKSTKANEGVTDLNSTLAETDSTKLNDKNIKSDTKKTDVEDSDKTKSDSDDKKKVDTVKDASLAKTDEAKLKSDNSKDKSAKCDETTEKVDSLKNVSVPEDKKDDKIKNKNPSVLLSVMKSDVVNDSTNNKKSSPSENNKNGANPVFSTNIHKTDDVCSICEMITFDKGLRVDKDTVNYLMSFVINRIKNWLPPEITIPIAPPPPPVWQVENDHKSRGFHLLYQQMDIGIIELKARMKEYKNLSALYADVLTIRHNVAVFHGVDSTEVQGAEYMMIDCRHDIEEMRQCVDCYRHSNEKLNSNWYCIPCNPPHELVWAKLRGFCFWPAKVINKVSSTQYDVRFFGSGYTRAKIDTANIKPIETPLSELKIKRTQTLDKAMEELKLHQTWILNPSEAEKQVASKPVKTPVKTNPVKSVPKKRKLITSPVEKNVFKKKITDEDVYEFHDSPSEEEISILENSTIGNSSIGKQASASAPQLKEPILKKKLIGKKKKSGNVPKKSNISAFKKLKLKFSKSMKNITKSGPSKELRRGRSRFLPNVPSRQEHEIIISDDDVIECADSSLNDQDPEFLPLGGHSSQDDLISSTQDIRTPPISQPTLSVEPPRLRTQSNTLSMSIDRPYSDVVDKLKQRMELCSDRGQLIRLAMDSLQDHVEQMENMQANHADILRNLTESHKRNICELKKKQWCYNCEQEAIYHCCWNTSYCSTTCQQQHWQTEHKKQCRRKR